MQLLTILGLAISSNLDTLGVALAYGARKFRLPLLSNFICALIPCLGTYLTMFIGSTLRRLVSGQLAGALGAGIISASGVVLIFQSLGKSRKAGRAGRPETTESGISKSRTATAFQPEGARENPEGPVEG